jgi:hypothetical protein
MSQCPGQGAHPDWCPEASYLATVASPNAREQGQPVMPTGSDQQQRADRDGAASVSASDKSEIPSPSYTIVVQGREWS